ncbi:MAG: radical SAM protein [Nitrospirae bacterium]|nr:radical SAM protein [Nitrospirota bacterium]
MDKNTVKLTEKKGKALGICATFNPKYICCKVQVLRAVKNCPFSCTYCFLQNYLNEETPQVVSDTGALIEEVKEAIKANPWRLFRVGTWELGDSLAFPEADQQVKELIEAFSEIPEAMLELKTKSSRVEHILGLSHRGKTVVSWSLNPEEVVQKEELHTASLYERLHAMQRVQEAGYLIGLHFDPMIHYPDWQRGYTRLVEQIFSFLRPEQIAWISIGSLRFNPEMKRLIEQNFPHTRITLSEMVSADDNKTRYVKPLRLQMYRLLYGQLKRHLKGEPVIIYLCMERWDMWERLFGFTPDSSEELDYLFAENLYKRFGIGRVRPERRNYKVA